MAILSEGRLKGSINHFRPIFLFYFYAGLIWVQFRNKLTFVALNMTHRVILFHDVPYMPGPHSPFQLRTIEPTLKHKHLLKSAPSNTGTNANNLHVT